MSKIAKLAFQDMKEMIIKLRKSSAHDFSSMVKKRVGVRKFTFELEIDPSENWVAGSTFIFTKESRRLNRVLGL